MAILQSLGSLTAKECQEIASSLQVNSILSDVRESAIAVMTAVYEKDMKDHGLNAREECEMITAYLNTLSSDLQDANSLSDIDRSVPMPYVGDVHDWGKLSMMLSGHFNGYSHGTFPPDWKALINESIDNILSAITLEMKDYPVE